MKNLKEEIIFFIVYYKRDTESADLLNISNFWIKINLICINYLSKNIINMNKIALIYIWIPNKSFI